MSFAKASELVGQSATRIRNYVNMGAIEIKEYNRKHHTQVNMDKEAIKLLKQPITEQFNLTDVKVVIKLIELLEDYFPIANLSQGQFDDFHDRIVSFAEKYRLKDDAE